MGKHFPYFFPFRKQKRYRDSPESFIDITGVSLDIQTYVAVPLPFQPI